MKLMCCDICHDVVKANKNEWKFCLCGEIGGRYLEDGKKFEVMRLTKRSRVIGVDNNVRYGFKRNGDCWIQNPGSKTGKNVTEIPYSYKMVIKQATDKLKEKKMAMRECRVRKVSSSSNESCGSYAYDERLTIPDVKRRESCRFWGHELRCKFCGLDVFGGRLSGNR